MESLCFILFPFPLCRKSLSFLKEFVLSEGLVPLSKMMQNDNLYERSQALEIFMSVTDCDAYDWFQPPAGHVDKLLHQKLLDLINHPHFLRNLLLNRKDSYPGGSFRALQILAFWLSWVRALYTKDQKLSLSRALMDELHQWSSQLPNPDSGILEEEVQLAKTLMDDFCKEYSQGDLNASPAAGVLSISGVLLPLEHPTGKSTTPISHAEAEGITVPPTQKTQVERIQELKEEGNVRYRAGDVDTALDKYEEALQLAGSLQGSDVSTDKQHELMVALYTNLSNALWKRYTLAKDTKRDEDFCQPLLAKITEQCELALTLHPTHTKAFYRLVTTMIEQHKHKEAYDRAEQFKTVLLQTKQTSQPGVESNGVGFSQQVADDIDRIARLQRKCTAVELLRCHESGTPFGNSSQWGMDKKRLKLLSTVLKRDHLHHILPTVIEETLPPSQDASNTSAVANLSSSSSSSSSAAVAAAKKAKEDIIKADPKVDKILSYLFEQRDESVDRDVTSRVTTTTKKKDSKKDTTATGASKKKSSSTAAAAAAEDKAAKPKVTAADRKMVQQIKRMAGTFSTLMLRAKSYSTEDPTIVGEKTKLLTEALEVTISLRFDRYFFLCVCISVESNANGLCCLHCVAFAFPFGTKATRFQRFVLDSG